MEGANHMMTAVLDPKKQEFLLFTPNVPLVESNCFAKLFLDCKTNLYVLKSRYCL